MLNYVLYLAISWPSECFSLRFSGHPAHDDADDDGDDGDDDADGDDDGDVDNDYEVMMTSQNQIS